MENTSGQGARAEIPDEIRGWSWGAFVLTWIWGLGNKVYIAFLCLIPYAGVIMTIVLGIKGNEWAWRNQKWDDIQHFKRVQKKWAHWGIGILIAILILGFLSAIIIPLLPSNKPLNLSTYRSAAETPIPSSTRTSGSTYQRIPHQRLNASTQ